MAEKKEKPLKLPKSMAACADMLFSTREERLAAQKIVDALQAKETALRNHIIDNLPKDSSGAMGKLAVAKVTTATEPRVEDWDKFYEHIRKTKGFELLNRAVNKAAVKERWEANKVVPGVTTFTVVKVSLTQVK